MKVLFIGGTGNISTSVSRQAVAAGFKLTLLNRGRSGETIPGARMVTADINDPAGVRAVLGSERFDVVVNWIAFTPAEVARDIDLFTGQTGQYIFISSASAYQKPPASPFITEATPLHNPFWRYSQQKIGCEESLMRAYRDSGFPVTIVRPSHTYDKMLPVAVGGSSSFTVAARIRRGQPVVVHGDGTSLWVVTHAEDFARGFLGLLGLHRSVGSAFHITSDEVLTWNQIYQDLGAALGVEPKLVHIPSEFIARIDPGTGAGLLGDKAHSVIFDNTRIKTFVPGYQAVIPFHLGVRRSLAWFEADPARMAVDAAADAALDRMLATFQRLGD